MYPLLQHCLSWWVEPISVSSSNHSAIKKPNCLSEVHRTEASLSLLDISLKLKDPVYRDAVSSFPFYGWKCDSSSKSYLTVRYTFALACLDDWSIRTVSTSSREVRTFLECQWMKCIPPVGISSILHINAWAVSKSRTCFAALADFLLSPLGHKQFTACW